MGNRHMSLSLTPRSGRAIGAADPPWVARSQACGPAKMPGFRVLTGVRKEASKMGARRPLRSVGTQITELTATQSAQLKRSQVHASAITRAYQQHPQPDRKTSKHPGVLCCFCVAAERCVVTCGISTTPGLSVGLSPASGVVRCILVTVEKNRARQLKSIARTHCGAGDVSLK